MTGLTILRSRPDRAVMACLIAHAQRVMARDPDEVIGGRYMRRRHGFKSLMVSEYVHLHVGSDPTPWLHDHPWPSASICLRGTLREIRDGPGDDGVDQPIRPGTVSLRPARRAHRIQVLNAPALALFIAGPRLRDLGWHLDDGWVHCQRASRVDSDGVIRVPLKPPSGGTPP